MDNKERLKSLIEETSITPDIFKRIHDYLTNKYRNVHDTMVINRMRDRIVAGDIDGIEEEDILNVIELLGGKIEAENINDINNVVKTEPNKVNDIFNETLVENQSLKNENSELKSKLEQVLNRLNKLESIFEKFNITNRAELVTIDDAEINKEYIEYLTKGKVEHKDIIIKEENDITKVYCAYYKLEKK